MSDIEMVQLRTGIEMPRPLVGATRIALELLLDKHPIAVYEAVMVARDRTHVPFGNTGEALKGMGLLQPDGRMHDATRDVILACTDGEELDLRFVSPYATEVAQ